MMRRAAVRMTWLCGALGVAIAVACKSGTTPPPPTESGHVTLTHAGSVDSFVAVLVPQGQLPETILGTYTHPLPDSIHVTGVVKVSGFPVGVEVPGRFMLQQNTLSVSGTLKVTGTSPHFVSFIGSRSGP